MDHKDRIRQKAEARLARLRPNTGHARNLRRKLGISDAPAPVEPVVEEVKAVEKPKATKKPRKTTPKTPEQ